MCSLFPPAMGTWNTQIQSRKKGCSQFVRAREFQLLLLTRAGARDLLSDIKDYSLGLENISHVIILGTQSKS